MSKKLKQLGMSPSTAQGRLVKDLLWDFVVRTGQDKCHHCGELMCRETFSIEHKTPWLDSDTPKETYFDLSNISFSHLSCNCRAARRGKYSTDEERIEARRKSNRESKRRMKLKAQVA
ncbi:HNH homing endonuclease [Acinetobacter phage AM24]|nr:HNH homing endonuclease [Acinetobacter phage AM24]